MRPVSAGAVRVLLADDHPYMRAGIRAALLRHRSIQVVAEAADGEEALRLALQLRPQIVLLDLEMPKLDGLEVCRRLHAQAPGVRCIIVTMHGDPEHLRRIGPAGARGYVLKDAPPEELILAIATVLAGRKFLSPALQKALLGQAFGRPGTSADASDSLTPREREVLRLVADGFSNKAAALRLGISVRTAEGHRARLMRKLGATSAAQLIKLALSRGLIGAQ